MDVKKREVISITESLCPHCLNRITAERAAYADQVYLEKTCPQHGDFRTLIWQGSPAWDSWGRPKIPTQPAACFTQVAKGCPFDCGLCPDHRQQSCSILLEVTQRCNLKCAFCFADAGAEPADNPADDPALEDISGWFEKLLAAGGPHNIQLSGGEPTLRDDLPDIINLGRSMGFSFFQLNTNGLRLAREPGYVKALKTAGLSTVFLQFDGTEDEIYRHLRKTPVLAEKGAAIDHCARHNLGVILVPTLIPGVNTHNIGAIIDFALSRLPVVRGVHFQPVSYFGRYPRAPLKEERITIPQVLRAIEEQTGGRIKAGNFKPPGCENALCSFHGNFIVQPGGELRPWTKQGGQSCCVPEKAAEGAQKARSFLARQWSAGHPAGLPAPGSDRVAASWDKLIARLQNHTFCISGMAFQDVWNLDLERLKDCCIHVFSPDGRLIPFCAYNLTDINGRPLYRRRR